jgi:transposase
LFQPAYSPEVNPAEHIWQRVRKNGNFKNKTFNSMEEVERQLVIAVKYAFIRQRSCQIRNRISV